MLWTYEDEDFNGSVSMEVNSDDIKYDAEYMNIFVEQLTEDVKWYMERAHELEKSYVKYHNNETFVGEMAERSKSFLYEVQGDVLHIKNIELKKDFLYVCSDIEEKFKEQVDPSPNARVSTRVLLKIKKDFGTYYAVIDTKGYEIECHAKRLVDMYSKWGISTIPYYRRSMMAFEEFCGNGEFLDTCIKKLENFDQDSCSALNGKDFIGNAQTLQAKINNTANGLDNMTVYQPNATKKVVSLVALGTNAVGTINTSGTKQKTITSSSLKKIDDASYIEAMKEQYGFSKEEAILLKTAYDNFLNATSIYGLSKKEKIKTFYSYLAGLQSQYSSEDFLFHKIADNPSPKKAVEFFNELGIDGEALKKAINNQHSTCYKNKKRDFAHECAIYSVMSYNNVIKKNSNSVDNVNALVGYKGDVYSGSMGDDDKKADIAAYNIYMRMLESQNGDPWDIMTEYNVGVSEGSINGEKEFLERYGNGDAEIGMKNLIKELDRKTGGTIIVSWGVSAEKVKSTKEEFLQYLSDKSGVKIE